MHEKREDEETNPFRHLAVQHLHGPEEIRCGERELVVVCNEIANARIADVTGVLYHYKFLGRFRDLTTDLVRTSSEATELRVRLELTERAESTLREELDRDREREQAERRVADLERKLEPSPEIPSGPPDGLEVYAEASEGAEPRPDTSGAQEGSQEPEEGEETARRPWWFRMFGG